MRDERNSALAVDFALDVCPVCHAPNYEGTSRTSRVVAGPWPKERQIRNGEPRIPFERTAKCLGRMPREIRISVRTANTYADDDIERALEALEHARAQRRAGKKNWAIELNNKLNPPPRLYDSLERRKRKPS
jgi:hypothetical protein